MVLRTRFIETVRSYINTPYVHQGRHRGKACDCLGLIIGSTAELGMIDWEAVYKKDNRWRVYSRMPKDHLLESCCQHVFKQSSVENMQFGDLVLFAWKPNKGSQHCAILTPHPSADFGIVHALNTERSVKEHVLSNDWRSHIREVYAMPGLED